MISSSSTTTTTVVNIPHHLMDHVPPGLSANGRGVQDFGSMSHGFHMQDFNINNGDHLQKPRLPLWLNQVNSNIPMDHISGNSNFYNVPEMVQNMGSASSGITSTLFGSSSSSMSSYGNSNHLVGFDNQKSSSTTIPNLSLSPLQVGLKEEGANRLYSSAEKQNSKPIAPMSATALLQKAAQMGSTRSSNTNPFFASSSSSSSSVMIMSSSASSSSSSSSSSSLNATASTTTMSFSTSLNQNRSNVNVNNMAEHHPHHHHGYLDGSNLSSISSNGLNQLVTMRKSGSSTTGKVSDQPVLNLINPSSGGIENGQTRDFLGSGSGGEFSQRQFLSHSIGSAMGLSQFAGNH